MSVGRLRQLGLTLALTTLVAIPAGASAQSSPSLPDIEDEVMCPICGTPLEQSQSPQAERERALIRRLIAEGRSKQEIKDALVAEYGPDVLALPEGEGFDLAAWLVPAAGIGGAAALVGWSLRRRRRERPAGSPLGQADEERLREDLSRYDL